MKVNIKHEELNRKQFCELSVGQVFLYGNEAWMKTAYGAEEADDDADEINAVCLEKGGFGYFWYEEVLIPKVAELNIEY